MKPTEQPRLVLSTRYTRCGALHPLRGATPDVGHCTRCGALHPLRRATPDVGRYTRSEEVQCLRIGCSATFNKHFRGHAITPIISRRAHHHLPQTLHPLRRATPDQKRCNAYGSGVAPLSTSTFATTRAHQSSADEHTTTSHKRCTLYVALHPMWGATPVQKRCNAYGSGAAPNATSIFADTHCPPDSASAHLPPSP